MSVVDDVFGADGLMAAAIPTYRPRDPQIQLATAIMGGMDTGKHVLAEGPCGCHVAGQGILMANGSIVSVENIVVGDRVMGADGQPRTVLELHCGEQETATITPIKGKPWTVNLDHVLTLVRYDNDRVSDMTVRDWLAASHNQKMLNKLFRVATPEFHRRPNDIPIDPYLLGLLLGDGSLKTHGSVSVTTADKEIRDSLYVYAEQMGLTVRETFKPNNKAKTYNFAGTMYNKGNALTTYLRLWNLRVGAEDKFVPDAYKLDSVDTRCAVLAGLMDADGHLSYGCFDFISKSKTLANDVAFMARSVGLAAYVVECQKSCQGGFTGTYHRVSISGDVDKIPCRLPRKQAAPRQQQKDPLRTGFTVELTGRVEPYYGFTLDGDGRYLLDDFTVTHNSGKSYAYLVPGIHQAVTAKKRVVIATANIALQEQLVQKDLPALAHALGGRYPFTYTLLKGVNNYLCLNEYANSGTALGQKALFQNQDAFAQYSAISTWADSTTTGDVSELPFVPAHQLWQRVSTTADACLKRDCSHADACFALKAKAKAAAADVIVTNYHLLFADAQIRSLGGQGVLPPYDILICDEAHEAADIAREFFGISVSQNGINALASTAASEVKALSNVARDLKEESDVFFSFLADYARSPQYKIRLKKPGFVNTSGVIGKLERVRDKLDEVLDKETDKAKHIKLSNLRKQADNAIEHIEECVHQKDAESVYWIEVTDKGNAKLRSKTVYVGPKLREHVFEKTECVVCVSATMTTGDPESPTAFEFIRNELGAPEDCIRVVGPNPFDFGTQALVVVPMGMPSPKEDGYTEAVADALAEAIRAVNGGVLGLFTSYKNLNAAYERVKSLPMRVMKQGELPRPELTRLFREDKDSVLLGTDSFWTGVDVPGEALRVVVIDRLPFTNPTDPVIDAISERDRNSFTTYLVPQAVIMFRQGVGRLIRTRTDVGAIVVLDHRVVSAAWGRHFWGSFPKGVQALRHINQIPGFIEWARQRLTEQGFQV